METPNFYGILPANVRYDKNLKPMEKILYTEITALANVKGYCYATNAYFANLYDVHKNTVGTWITNLEEQGYIKTEIIYKENTKEIIERRIYIITKIDTPINKNIDTPQEKNCDPINKNIDTPINENIEENNININIINYNNIFTYSIFQSPKFKERMDYFLNVLQKKRKEGNGFNLSQMEVELFENKLQELSNGNEEIAIKIIEQSIRNNWNDFYKLKENKANKPNYNSNKQFAKNVQDKFTGVTQESIDNLIGEMMKW